MKRKEEKNMKEMKKKSSESFKLNKEKLMIKEKNRKKNSMKGNSSKNKE